MTPHGAHHERDIDSQGSIDDLLSLVLTAGAFVTAIIITSLILNYLGAFR